MSYYYDSVMKKIMRDRYIKKAYEAAKTDAERMEIICETAFEMEWDERGYEDSMNNMFR